MSGLKLQYLENMGLQLLLIPVLWVMHLYHKGYKMKLMFVCHANIYSKELFDRYINSKLVKSFDSKRDS